MSRNEAENGAERQTSERETTAPRSRKVFVAVLAEQVTGVVGLGQGTAEKIGRPGAMAVGIRAASSQTETGLKNLQKGRKCKSVEKRESKVTDWLERCPRMLKQESQARRDNLALQPLKRGVRGAQKIHNERQMTPRMKARKPCLWLAGFWQDGDVPTEEGNETAPLGQSQTARV